MTLRFFQAYSRITLILLSSCSGSSYVPGYQPEAILCQKRTSGGIIYKIGGELNAPTFTLLANGKIIFFDYINGKRTLVYSKLNKNDFSLLYNRITSFHEILKTERNQQTTDDDVLPVVTLNFHNDTVRFRMSDHVDTTTAEGRLMLFSRWLDSFRANNAKSFRADSVILFVRPVSAGNPELLPAWPLLSVGLDTLVRIQVSMYEPNSEKNSAILNKPASSKIQKLIPQSGIYQKFTYKNRIYAVGYRPLIP